MKRINKYLIFLIVFTFCFTPLIWFWGRGNILINGVDTNFPLDPFVWFQRRLFIWHEVSNAGADFSSSTAGLFFHFIQVIPYSLGFNLQLVQIFSLFFWFSAIVLGSFFLARYLFPKSSLTQILFTVIYSFNIYLFNSWENVKVANLSLVAAIPFALLILMRLKDRNITRAKAAFFVSLVGVLVSGAGINPAYIICFYLVLTVFYLSQIILERNKGEVLKITQDFLLLAAVISLINAFWILPTVNFIFSSVASSNSINDIGFTNWIDSLSENTSLLNVFRLQGAWDWYALDASTGKPLYIPYSTKYFHSIPFIVFSFLLTGLAILSFIYREHSKNRLYIFFGLSLVIGVFLGAGTHSPTGSLYSWMVSYIPFFSLFRSPWYIFTPLTVLSLAGLVSLLVYQLFQISEPSSHRKLSISFLPKGLVFILIVGNLLYAYPLVSGKIFRPNEENRFFINFPEYVFETNQWLKSDPLPEGRVIGYPEDEIERFTWGYVGIESILNLFSKEETVFTSLNAPDSPLANIAKEFYMNLRKGNIESAKILAGRLNIGTVFEKKDQSSLSGDISSVLKPYLIKSIGDWNFYNLRSNDNPPKIFVSNNYILAYPYNKSEKFFASLGERDVVLNPSDSIILNIPELKSSKKVILAENSQDKIEMDFSNAPSKLSSRLLARDLSTVSYDFEAKAMGNYRPIIEKYGFNSFGLDISKGLELELDGQKTTWEVDKLSENYLFLKPINLSEGKHTVKLSLKNENLVQGGNFEEGIKFKKGKEGQYELMDEEGGKNKYLSISNMGKEDLTAEFPVNSFDPYLKYYIEVKFKNIYGNHGSLLITQSGKNTLYKAEYERLPNHPEWKVLNFFYRPVNVSSNMLVGLQAPFTNDPFGTKILFDDLKVHKVFTNNLIFSEANTANEPIYQTAVNFYKKSPVEYDIEVQQAAGSHILVFQENYSSGWELEMSNEMGEKITNPPIHFSANLYANAWYIENAPSHYKAKIYYKPQKLYQAGLTISVMSLFVMTGFYIKSIIKRKKKYD
jgi:hypothetical protein